MLHVLSQPAATREGALAVRAREASSSVHGSNVIPEIDLRREQHATITALVLLELRVILPWIASSAAEERVLATLVVAKNDPPCPVEYRLAVPPGKTWQIHKRLPSVDSTSRST